MRTPKNRLQELAQNLHRRQAQNQSSGQQQRNGKPNVEAKSFDHNQPIDLHSSKQEQSSSSQRGSVEAMAFDHNEAIELRYDQATNRYAPNTPTYAAAHSITPDSNFGSETFEVEAFEAEPVAPAYSMSLIPEVVTERSQPLPTKSAVPPAQSVSRDRAIAEPKPTTPQAVATAEDFLEDLQAILKGEKTYDDKGQQVVDASPQATQFSTPDPIPPTSSTSTSAPSTLPAPEEPIKQPSPHDVFDRIAQGLPPEPPPTAPEPTYSSAHSVFDRMGKNMTFANSFDLGTISLNQRFDEFDRVLDAEEKHFLNIDMLKTQRDETNENLSLQKSLSTQLSGSTELTHNKVKDIFTSFLRNDIPRYFQECTWLKSADLAIKNAKEIAIIDYSSKLLGWIDSLSTENDSRNKALSELKESLKIKFPCNKELIHKITKDISSNTSILETRTGTGGTTNHLKAQIQNIYGINADFIDEDEEDFQKVISEIELVLSPLVTTGVSEFIKKVVEKRDKANREKMAIEWSQYSKPCNEVHTIEFEPKHKDENFWSKFAYYLMITEPEAILRDLALPDSMNTYSPKGIYQLVLRIFDIYSSAACHNDALQMMELMSEDLRKDIAPKEVKDLNEAGILFGTVVVLRNDKNRDYKLGDNEFLDKDFINYIEKLISAKLVNDEKTDGPLTILLRLRNSNNHSVLLLITRIASRTEYVMYETIAGDPKSVLYNNLISDSSKPQEARLPNIIGSGFYKVALLGSNEIEYELCKAASSEKLEENLKNLLRDRITTLNIGLAYIATEESKVLGNLLDVIDISPFAANPKDSKEAEAKKAKSIDRANEIFNYVVKNDLVEKARLNEILNSELVQNSVSQIAAWNEFFKNYSELQILPLSERSSIKITDKERIEITDKEISIKENTKDGKGKKIIALKVKEKGDLSNPGMPDWMKPCHLYEISVE